MRGVESAGILNSEYFGDNLEHVWLDGGPKLSGTLSLFSDLHRGANYVAACRLVWFACNAAEHYSCTGSERS